MTIEFTDWDAIGHYVHNKHIEGRVGNTTGITVHRGKCLIAKVHSYSHYCSRVGLIKVSNILNCILYNMYH